MAFSIDSYKSEIISLFKEGKNEIMNIFDLGLSKYVDDYYNKISQVNTFLFQTDKVNFYDVFYPLYIDSYHSRGFAENSYQRIHSSSLISDIFSRSNCICLIGYAGSGKSMLARHLFLESCNSSFFKKIPVLIELRALNTAADRLKEIIFSTLLSNKVKPDYKILDRSLHRGNFLFIFDGYDEIKPEILEKVTNDIESFFDEYNKNQFVITSRPESNVERLSRVVPYHVEPLDDKMIFQFLEKQLIKLGDVELLNKMVDTINNPKNYDYKTYLANPLLLSMFILAYSIYPELPKYKGVFYRNVIDTLITKHDSITKKGGYKHPRKSKLTNEDLKNVLKAFSYISFFEAKYDFDADYLKDRLKFIREKLTLNYDLDDIIYDFSVSLSILLLDGAQYKFPHRTLQDYLSISFIKDLDDVSKENIYSIKLVDHFEQQAEVNYSFASLCNCMSSKQTELSLRECFVI